MPKTFQKYEKEKQVMQNMLQKGWKSKGILAKKNSSKRKEKIPLFMSNNFVSNFMIIKIVTKFIEIFEKIS